MLKAEGSRKSVQTAAALATALAEGDRLRAEAEEHEYIVAQLDLDAQQTAAQANTLSQRLAEAEQDLGFEVTRNAQRAQGTGEGNARLRASALAAAKRIAAAENALRDKGRAIEKLRSKCAREGVGGFSRSKREQRSGGGGKRAAASPTSGLEFRVFAARADAQAAVERSTVAAVERRSAAGSLLAEALRAAGSKTVATMANEAGVDSCSSQGDDDSAGMAGARKLASASVANERREVAGLALRSAEAKMRRSADLTLRARFSHQPVLNPKELGPEEASRRSGIRGASSYSTTRDRVPAAAGSHPHDRASARHASPIFGEGGTSHAKKPYRKDRVEQILTPTPGEGDIPARTIPMVDSSRPSSSSALDGWNHDNVGDIYGSDTVAARTFLVSSRRKDQDSTAGSDGSQRQRRQQQEPVDQDGLRELKREISDLEGKILVRLGVDGGGDACIEVKESSGVHGDRDGDEATGEHLSGGCGDGGDSAGARFVKRPSRAIAASSQGRQAPPRGCQQRDRPRRSSVPSPDLAPDAEPSVPRRRAKSGSALSSDRKKHCLERASYASRAPRVRGRWETTSAISSTAASASGRSRKGERNDEKKIRVRSKTVGTR